MPSENVDRVLAEVRSLTAAEREELRTQLNSWPKPSHSAEDDLDQRLLSAGVISSVPASDATLPYRRWKPIAVKGKALSETIIADRR